MSEVRNAGIRVEVPAGWEASISGGGFKLLADGARQPTILHMSTFPLPTQRGSFGSGAVNQMGNDDIFITLFEYGEESVGTALFASRGIPRELLTGDFDRNALQHALPGQSGLQHFFTENDRAFCLYVVIGSHIDRFELVPRVNAALNSLVIE